MAGRQNFADFGIARESNCYYYWQNVSPEFQPGQADRCGIWCEQPQGSSTLSRCSYTVAGNGPQLLMHEVAAHLAGTSVMPQETNLKTKFPAEGQDEDSLEDPNRPLNIKELNKEFMARSEELYDSLMGCRWQPLDTVLSSIPEQTPK